MRSRVLLLAVLAAACTPKRVHEEPVIRQGDRVPTADAAIERSRAESAEAREARGRVDSLSARALADCEPEVCNAIARGEITLGMSAAQLLAATRTTESAWSIRSAGSADVFVPAAPAAPPRDVSGELAMVQLTDGRIAAIAYREAQGVRVVSQPADATTEGRAVQLAEMLLREGDDLAARGDLAGALDRYDRAHILRPHDPLTEYRIATVLDKQLRPIEALVRYRLFLHQLELEKIEATGRAYGYLAEAIAHARERVLILERQAR